MYDFLFNEYKEAPGKVTCSRSPKQEVAAPTVELGSHSNAFMVLSLRKLRDQEGCNLSSCPKRGTSTPHLYRREIPLLLPSVGSPALQQSCRADRPVLR